MGLFKKTETMNLLRKRWIKSPQEWKTVWRCTGNSRASWIPKLQETTGKSLLVKEWLRKEWSRAVWKSGLILQLV